MFLTCLFLGTLNPLGVMLSNAEGGLSSSILLVKVKLGGEGVAC